jgi:serine/threonine-protein kinase
MALGRERFLREIKLAASLQHPNILPVYDSGDAGGTLYYVMPFVEGESLRDRLDREPQLPLEDALQITREVADALSYAHGRDVVHRDIKPENIMMSGGHAIVADFGIARAISAAGGQKLTETGLAIGTPAYMSPEQSSGMGQVDRRSDIYSLACVLYETLAGQPPFTGPTAQAIMARHSLDAVPRLRIVRETIPDALEAVINRALAKVPADRYSTAEQFAAALTGASTGSVSRITAARLPPLPGGGRAWQKPALVAGVIAVLAGLGWIIFGWKGTAGASTSGGLDSRRVAVLYFSDLSRDSSLGHVAAGLTEGLIGELAKVRVLNVVSPNGVAPYRAGDIARDSIARALHAGTLVEGSVDPVGDRVRVTVRLVEGSSGADVGQRATFTLPVRQLLQVRDSVIQEAARLLRARLGAEVQLRELQAGTSNPEAWALVQRATNARRTGERALETGDAAAAARMARQADSLSAQAEVADPAWVEPPVLRGYVALLEARTQPEGPPRGPRLRDGLDHVRQALRLDPADAAALALRGTLRYQLWRLTHAVDARGVALLDSAQSDLETALRTDPTLASAHAVLSQLYYFPPREDLVAALLEARAAYDADAYLRDADRIVDRLFWASHDLAQFPEARRWCDEGGRRFPKNWRFAQCQLWLMLIPGAAADVPQAWAFAARTDSLTPAPQRALYARWHQILVAGVIGRAGLRDSAEHVFARARTDDPGIDPEQDLPGFEAMARAQMGDDAGAIALLKRYVATHPGHSFQRGGTLHWWWRGLERQPGFQAVLRAQAH